MPPDGCFAERVQRLSYGSPLIHPVSPMRLSFALASLLVLAACDAGSQQEVDLILYNANIYTVNPDQPRAEALAVRGDTIVAVGSTDDLREQYRGAREIDADGQMVTPGLIDAHAHLMGLGMALIRVDLVGTESKEEVLERLTAFEADLPEGAWLVGRGWDQNDWPEQEFPTNADLDDAFPSRPVWLTRIDGHAAWANSAAMRVAGMERLRTVPDPEGGKVIRDLRGNPTGVFIDSAMPFISQHQPETTDAEREQALQLAIAAMNEHGLTGIHDAGAPRSSIELFQRAIDADSFDVRAYVMIGGRGATFDHYCENGPILDYGDKLTVRSVKFYMDGALGSRGAALLDDYADEPGNRGLLRQDPDAFTEDVRQATACGFQINTHAIGDRGNRVVLDGYEAAADTAGRHRIEHAQVVALDDIPRFADLNIIASMQPTHATSDMYWAEDRVGEARGEGAYVWRGFLDQGTRLALGSDFPVEKVDPLLGFYAAITRQDAEGWPEGGWHPDERLTREEALRGFTLDAAYAAFQENQLGSLEPGKLADFTIFDRDLMTVPEAEILQAEVVATYLGGKAVYEQ